MGNKSLSIRPEVLAFLFVLLNSAEGWSSVGSENGVKILENSKGCVLDTTQKNILNTQIHWIGFEIRFSRQFKSAKNNLQKLQNQLQQRCGSVGVEIGKKIEAQFIDDAKISQKILTDKIKLSSQFNSIQSPMRDLQFLESWFKGGLKKTFDDQIKEDLLVKGAKASKNVKAHCGNVDLRNQFGFPIRNQKEMGWCFGFSAADLLSFKLKKMVSAFEVTRSYYRTLQGSVQKFLSQTGELTQGGWTGIALQKSLDEGVCLESDLPSERNQDQKSMTEFLEGLKTWAEIQSFDKGFALKENDAISLADDLIGRCEIKKAFPTLKFDKVLKLARDVNEEVIYESLAQSACRNRQSVQGYNVGGQNRDLSGNQRFQAELNHQLENQNPLAIEYSTTVFSDPYQQNFQTNHASVLMGRRYVPQTGTCEYLIRNSWGTSAPSDLDTDIKFEAGYLWVPESALFSNLHSYSYLY